MERRIYLHPLLGTIGIVALLAYLLACRPAWSPDGSKVLFPYVAGGQTGVALFDKNTGKTRSLMTVPTEGDSDWMERMPWTQWDDDGQRAIVAWAVKERSVWQVRVLPVDSAGPTKDFIVPHDDNPGPSFGLEFAALDGALYIGGETLIRLDLTTGKIKRRKLKEGQSVFLVAHDGDLYYCAMNQGAETEYEIGTVRPEKLSLKSAVTLPQEEVGELMPTIGMHPRGPAIAMPSRKDGRWQLVVVRGDALDKLIPLELSAESHGLGNPEWSADGKTIYAPLAEKAEEGQGTKFSLAEITVATGQMRVTPLLQMQGTFGDDELDMASLFCQIALSPDGKTIAASPVFFKTKPEDEANRALLLVDLTSLDRTITRIPVPAP